LGESTPSPQSGREELGALRQLAADVMEPDIRDRGKCAMLRLSTAYDTWDTRPRMGRSSWKPPHKIRLTIGFIIGRTSNLNHGYG
jgi:hypothetical protein